MCVWQTRIQRVIREQIASVFQHWTSTSTRLEIEKPTGKKNTKTTFNSHHIWKISGIERDKQIIFILKIFIIQVFGFNFACLLLRGVYMRNEMYLKIRETRRKWFWSKLFTVLDCFAREWDNFAKRKLLKTNSRIDEQSEMRYNDTVTQSRNTLYKMSVTV